MDLRPRFASQRELTEPNATPVIGQPSTVKWAIVTSAIRPPGTSGEAAILFRTYFGVAMKVAGVKRSPDSSGVAMSNIFTSFRKWKTRRTR